jgi:4-diphosphocytidyl-2-C-methyl-D-erythritol kinase
MTLTPGAEPAVTTSGAFAAALVGENILARTLSLLAARAPSLILGGVHLDKELPVAAGIGGGSADAAALLRAVRRANGAAADAIDWFGLAALLGADVSVCLESRPLWMTGAGATLVEVDGGLPPLDAVLVNPMAPVPADKTAQVYRALGAGPLPRDFAPPPLPKLGDRRALLAYVGLHGNGLGAAAAAVVPEVSAVLAALQATAGVEHVAVSGGGPTCFGLYPDAAAADAARAKIAADHPGWWVAAVRLGNPAQNAV